MQGPSSFPAQGNPQALGALAEGGIVRHRQLPLQQVKQGPEKPFGSPQGQMKDAAHHQQALDCSVGILNHPAFGGRRASEYPLRWSIGLLLDQLSLRPSTHNCWTTIAKTNFRRQPAGITVTITPMVGRRHPPDHRKAERDGHQSISGATPFPLTITRRPPCPIIWTKS